MLLLSKQRIEPSSEAASAWRARFKRQPCRRRKSTRSSKSTAECPGAGIWRAQLYPGLSASGARTLSREMGLGSTGRLAMDPPAVARARGRPSLDRRVRRSVHQRPPDVLAQLGEARRGERLAGARTRQIHVDDLLHPARPPLRSEEHTSEL